MRIFSINLWFCREADQLFGVVKLYSQNLLDRDYLNTSAYPGTPVTVGMGITLEL